MEFINATLILLSLSLLVILNTIVCYVVSVRLGHVYPVIPFISETGSHPPESCIFSIMTSICSLCILVFVWLRSQQVENHVSELKRTGQHSDILATNKIGYRIGVFAALNLFGVAHFQELNIITIHGITAVSFFVGFVVYMHKQSFISRHTQLSTPFITQLRLRQSQFQTLMVFLHTFLAAVTDLQLNGINARDVTPADNGHLCHTLAAICEYAAVLNMAIYNLTFYKETLRMSIRLPKVYLDGDNHRVHNRP